MSISPVVSGFLATDIRLGADIVSAHRCGTGPAVVLFHSLLADRSSFDRVAPSLARSHTVVALDLPGFGGSTAANDGLDAVADRIAEAVSSLNLEHPVTFIGNGYGGFVALLTAIRHPALADRLVLADCGAAFDESGRGAFRAMSANASKSGMSAIADVAMRRLFAPAYQLENPDLIAERRERFVAMDPATFHAACEALATLDLRDRLSEVKIPALVLCGEFDEATPPFMSRELAAGLSDATLIELKGCAHVPQLQAPELFLGAIQSFISPKAKFS